MVQWDSVLRPVRDFQWSRSKAATMALLLGLASVLVLRHRAASCRFVETSPGVYRCTQSLMGYMPTATLLRMDSSRGVLSLLRKPDVHWVLVDASAPDTLLGAYASALARAVRRHLSAAAKPPRAAPPGLDLIVMTHGHASGAVPKLIAQYPDALVVLHETELPMLAADGPSEAPGEGPARRLRCMWPKGLPWAARMLR